MAGGINGVNGKVGGAGKAGSSGMSLDGLKAMNSIRDALGEMRVALAKEMEDISDAIGRNPFNIG